MNVQARFISIAVVAFILGVLGTLWVADHLWEKQRATPGAPDLTKKKLVQEYTLQELKRLGLDCKQASNQLKQIVQLRVEPLRVSYRSAGDWRALLNEEFRKEIETTREMIFSCNRLYALGDDGKLNDLQDLNFLDSVMPLFAQLRRTLIFELSPDCNSACAEKAFSELEDVSRRMIKILK